MIAFLAVGALLVGPALAGDKVDSKAAEAGRALFSRHCAACHGAEGKGGGPVAGSLKAPLPDLTKLALKDGRFDEARVRTSIDGTQASTAHGTREMPVWGKVLANTGKKRGEGWAQAEVWTIVEYVKSIQAPR
jgi:mono/diheme cytochrome c family protein